MIWKMFFSEIAMFWKREKYFPKYYINECLRDSVLAIQRAPEIPIQRVHFNKTDI